MRTVDADLKNKNFKHVYLLYGDESYLIRAYKKMLIEALLPEGDTMNYNKFSGSDTEENEIIATANTLPFFGERRVILVEESGLLNHTSENLPGLIEDLPDYLYIIFAEKTVNKSVALYKRIAKLGVVEELTMPKGKDLQTWALRRIKSEGLNITKNAWEVLLERASSSLDNMANELDKLIDYCRDKGSIEEEDVNEICTATLEEKIFDMLDGISEKNPRKLMDCYHDMNLLQVNAQRILATMYTQFSRMLAVKSMAERKASDNDIASELKMHPYAVKLSRAKAKQFSATELRAFISDICDMDGMIKTGQMDASICLETLMLKYAT